MKQNNKAFTLWELLVVIFTITFFGLGFWIIYHFVSKFW